MHPALQSPNPMPPPPPCLTRSDTLEGHVAALVEAEVARTLAKCGGLGEVAARLQQAQVRGRAGRRAGGALRGGFWGGHSRLARERTTLLRARSTPT